MILVRLINEQSNHLIFRLFPTKHIYQVLSMESTACRGVNMVSAIWGQRQDMSVLK